MKSFPPQKLLECHNESEFNLSASDLLQKSNNCARNLQQNGLEKGDIALIFSEENEDTTPLILGCLVTGVIFSIIDSNLKTSDTTHALHILQPKAIFYDGKLLPKIEYLMNTSDLKLFLPFGDSSHSVSKVLFGCNGKELCPVNFNCTVAKITACILFTSGTAGRPKKVLISQHLLRQNVLNLSTVSPEDVIYVATQSRWLNNLFVLLQPLFTSCLRIVSKSKDDPLRICEAVRDRKVTQFFGELEMLSIMMVINETKLRGSLNTLQEITFTGESYISQNMKEHLIQMLPDCNLTSLYSMTEVGGAITRNKLLDEKELNEGYLLPGFQIKIVDKNYNSLNPGECGVLFLKFSAEFLGYFQDNIRNSQHFTEDGWFNTEDYARIHESGLVEILGRCSDNIFCAGYLVSFLFNLKAYMK